ncbi:trypsin-like serine protease [Streptomyces collinus]|uniref:Peptidase S1 domain-containing protein n=1 Tax=Streptomyces collinus TaxID=42684 RepID=A0AA89TZ18_STRCU|nr:trypsin-like serine protease [Streptomyces collinus]MBB5816325.1 hypothetical protein [Streptomyces collinus]WMX69143.1 trypsin-like peptidase domain-containing protein [Streptomyces collinus]
MDQQRIMEIWCSMAGSGTGYLIGDRFVLTVYHVVRHAVHAHGERLEVRQLDRHGRSAWLSAKQIWPEHEPDLEADPGADAALLMITDPAWQPFTGEPVRWGRLSIDNRQRVPCLAVGFPESEHQAGIRDTKEMRGHIEPLTAVKSGLITVHVDHSAAPSQPSVTSRWAGGSGAALFCGPLLVGVVTIDRTESYQANQLTAVAVASLMERPGFRRILNSRASLALEEIAESETGERNLTAVISSAFRSAFRHAQVRIALLLALLVF